MTRMTTPTGPTKLWSKFGILQCIVKIHLHGTAPTHHLQCIAASHTRVSFRRCHWLRASRLRRRSVLPVGKLLGTCRIFPCRTGSLCTFRRNILRTGNLWLQGWPPSATCNRIIICQCILRRVTRCRRHVCHRAKQGGLEQGKAATERGFVGNTKKHIFNTCAFPHAIGLRRGNTSAFPSIFHVFMRKHICVPFFLWKHIRKTYIFH